MIFFFSPRRASAIVYGLIIIAITSFVLLSLMQFVISNLKLGFHAEPKEQSLHIAEAGVYFYRWHLAHNVEGRTATQVSSFWSEINKPIGVDDNGNGDCDDLDATPDNYDANADGNIDSNDSDGTEAYVSVYSDGSTEIGYYSICVTKPTEYSSIVIIKSTGWTKKKPNLRRTVKARLRKPSWSEKAVLADSFTRLSSGTEIFGPIHGNNGFRFDGTAHNLVTASVVSYFDPDINQNRPGVWASQSGNSDAVLINDSNHFLAGKKYPVPPTDFSAATADFNVIKTRASSDGLYFNSAGRGRHIILGQPSDQQMTIKTVYNYNTTTYAITSEGSPVMRTIPDEGVLYVEDNVWVEGTMSAGKRLTIAAHDPNAGRTRSIFVGMNDLTYENYTSDTVLGLMAEDSIHIIRDAKHDLHIDGALLAQTGNIGWTAPPGKFWAWKNIIIDNPSKVTINGAMVSFKRMGFGYTNGAGYTDRELIFDANLIIQPPPMFPAGESYAIDLWDEIE